MTVLKEFFYLVLVICSVLGKDTKCGSGFRQTVLNSHNRDDFSVTSDVQGVDALLDGSGETFVGAYGTSFTVKATGQRQGTMGPMSRGFIPEELCFHTKCATELVTKFVGRTPEPRPVLVDGKVVGWAGNGGGVSWAQEALKTPRRFVRQCISTGWMYGRITFHLSTNPRVRASCGQIMVKGLLLRGCIDEQIEVGDQSSPQGSISIVTDTAGKK